MKISNDVIKKFWSNVRKNRVSCCWEWIGTRNKEGYGKIKYTGGQLAHRLSWIIHNEPIPKGICVLHDCSDGDNRACVNPDHLWLGTKGDNNTDTNRKGRNNPLKGNEHWTHKHPEKIRIKGDNHYFRKHPEKIPRGENHPESKISNHQRCNNS